MSKRTTYIRQCAALLLILGVLVGCQKHEDPIKLQPNAGPSFENVESEQYHVQLNAVPLPAGVDGTWQLFMGENGHFEDIHDPKSKFFGEPGEQYVIGWQAGHGEAYRVDEISVSFKSMNPQMLHPQPDSLSGNISVYLHAAEVRFGATGQWEVTEGAGGRILQADSHRAEFIGRPQTAYTVTWTTTYGSKSATVSWQFVTDELRADAGADQLDIKAGTGEEKYVTLEAFQPAGSAVEWALVGGEGGKLINSNIPSALFSGKADERYELQYTVTLDDQVSVDTVQIRFRGKWGMWKDERDGQSYRFIEHDGMEWMADNYNYAAYPGEGSWVYGFGYRAVVVDGHALETEEDRKKYGRLYHYLAAVESAPEGWRIPTVEEYEKLISDFGGGIAGKVNLEIGGASGMELPFGGDFEINSGTDPANRNVFSGQEIRGHFWTSNYAENYNSSYIFIVPQGLNDAGMGVYPVDYYMSSVRYVRDVQ